MTCRYVIWHQRETLLSWALTPKQEEKIKLCCLGAWKVGSEGVRNGTSGRKSLYWTSSVWTSDLQLMFKYLTYSSVLYFLHRPGYTEYIYIYIYHRWLCCSFGWSVTIPFRSKTSSRVEEVCWTEALKWRPTDRPKICGGLFSLTSGRSDSVERKIDICFKSNFLNNRPVLDAKLFTSKRLSLNVSLCQTFFFFSCSDLQYLL